MKKIDHMAEESLKERSVTYISDKDKKKLSGAIASAVAALVFFAAGLLLNRLAPGQATVAELLYLISVMIIGIPVLVTAVKGFLHKDVSASMEMLVSVAMLVAVLDGQFIVAVLIPVILTVVHFFEEKSIMGGRDAIEGLKQMQAHSALLFTNGKEQEVKAETLREGDVILVKSGMSLPIDGTVLQGEANMDQKSLTGESLPKSVGKGDKVYAGTTSIDGLLTVRVDKAYQDTSFNRIVQLLENAETMKLPEARLVDRFMKYYIPFVLAVAALIWFFTKDIARAVAVLVVSCPCGYMLVSSAPIIAALGAASKRGILIKNPTFIEKLTDADSFIFDKTGTITNGTLEAVEFKLFGAESEEELLKTAAAVAHGSLHPASKAIVRLCRDLDYATDYTITEKAGNGVTGRKGEDTVILGSRRYLERSGYTLPCDDAQTGSTTWTAHNETVLGCIVFRDILRDDAAETFDSLRRIGVKRISVMTGDNRVEAQKIAESVTVDDLHCELLPEQKLELLKKEKENHTVVMVGDGINDSLALSEADVGIAMGAMGSNTAIESADISLMNNSMRNLPFIVVLARKTKEIIDQNIIIAFLTSFLMIFLAAIGVVTPILGAFLHNAGAFIVLFNSARVSKADLKKAEKEEEQAAEQEEGDSESPQTPAELTVSASHEPEEAQRQPDDAASE